MKCFLNTSSLNINCQFAIVAGTFALIANVYGNAAAQSTPEMPKATTAQPEIAQPEIAQPEIAQPEIAQPKEMPASEPKMDAMPSTPMAPTAVPEAPASAPTDSIPMPTSPQASPELPALKSVPVEPTSPKVSTTSNPSTGAVPAATTMVLPQETITGIKSVDLPAPPPIQPAYFTLPIVVQVAKDPGLTSSTPISDRYTSKENWDVKAWAAAVSSCLQQKPKLMRVVGDEQVPFMLNGTEGTIMLNSSDKAVCPM